MIYLSDRVFSLTWLTATSSRFEFRYTLGTQQLAGVDFPQCGHGHIMSRAATAGPRFFCLTGRSRCLDVSGHVFPDLCILPIRETVHHLRNVGHLLQELGLESRYLLVSIYADAPSLIFFDSLLPQLESDSRSCLAVFCGGLLALRL